MEKAMAPHSSTLAWKIPWMEEPGRLQSMGSLRVRHDWATSLSLFTFMHWRRKWQPAPVFLPGESQGRGSLVGCHLWGRTESDTTEATQQQQQQQRQWTTTQWASRGQSWEAAAFLWCDLLFILPHSCSVTKLRPPLCDLMDCSTPGFPVLYYLLELVQTHVHWVDSAIQLSHSLSPPSPDFNPIPSIRVFPNY